MLTSIIYIIIGLAGLIFGGDWLVDGAVGIAQRAKISPMVIGLTIVAFGTSAPELLVSIQSAVGGNPGIALGNVIGSNVANIALILGVTAIIHPVPVHRSTTRIDAPFLFLASLALTLICTFTGTITRLEGIIGLLLLFCFVGYQIHSNANHDTSDIKDTAADADDLPAIPLPLWRSLLYIVLGIAALKYGAQFLVDGSVEVAHSLGVTDRIIGLTVVAVGTSLPELFASVIAARKGNVDLAIGNVIGSNLFNILCVLAASCAIHPIDLALVGPISTDCIWMLALTSLIWFQLRTDYRLSRSEGAILLCTYATFIALTIVK